MSASVARVRSRSPAARRDANNEESGRESASPSPSKKGHEPKISMSADDILNEGSAEADWQRRKVRDEMIAASKLHLNIIDDLPQFLRVPQNAKRLVASAPDQVATLSKELQRAQEISEGEERKMFAQSEEGRALQDSQQELERQAKIKADQEAKLAKEKARAERARQQLALQQQGAISGLERIRELNKENDTDEDTASETTSASTGSRLSHDLNFSDDDSDGSEGDNQRVRSQAELNLMNFSMKRMSGMSQSRRSVKPSGVPGRARARESALRGSQRSNQYSLIQQRLAQEGAGLMDLKSFHAKSVLVRNAHNLVTKNRFSFRTSNGFSEPVVRGARGGATGDILRQGMLLPSNSGETHSSASRFERYMVLCVSVFKEDYDKFLDTLQNIPHRRRPNHCEQVLVLVRHHPFFRNMPKKLALEVCRRMTFVNVASGTVIFQQGASGDCFYLINTGSTEVQIRDGSKEGIRFRLYPGDIFGEGSVADNEPRDGTVTAKEDVSLIRIDRETYETMSGYFEEENENLLRFVKTRLARPFFNEMKEEALRDMLQLVSAVTYKRGDVIVRQGIIPSHPCLFIVKRGRCRGFKAVIRGGSAKQTGTNICYLNIGDVFGSFTPDILVCPYSVVAMSEVTVFKLSSRECSAHLPKPVLERLAAHVQSYNIGMADMIKGISEYSEWHRYRSMVLESCDKQFQVKKTAISRANPITSRAGRDMELPKAPVPDHHTPLPNHLLKWSSDKLLSKLSLNFSLIPAKVEGGKHDGIKRVEAMSHNYSHIPVVELDDSVEMDEEEEQAYVQNLINQNPMKITEKVASREVHSDRPSKILTSQEALRYSSASLRRSVSLPARVIEKADMQRRGIITGISEEYANSEMTGISGHFSLNRAKQKYYNRDTFRGNTDDNKFTQKTLEYIAKEGIYRPLALDDVPVRNRLLDRLAEEVNDEADQEILQEQAKFERDQARLAKLKEQLKKNENTGDVIERAANMEADEHDALVLRRLQAKQLLDVPEMKKKSVMDFSDEYYDDLVRRRTDARHKAIKRADRLTRLPPSVRATSMLNTKFVPVVRLSGEAGGEKRGLPDVHRQMLAGNAEEKARRKKQRVIRRAIAAPKFVTHVSSGGYTQRNPFIKGGEYERMLNKTY